jgi:hypothetical protein
MRPAAAVLGPVRPALVVAVCLWALAASLAGYAVWAHVELSGYVAEAIAAGQLSAEESRFDIADSYMARSWQHLALAVVLAVLGWLVLVLRRPQGEAQGGPAAEPRTASGRGGAGVRFEPVPDPEDDLDDLLSTMEPSDRPRSVP